MIVISSEHFAVLLKQNMSIKPRIKRSVKFGANSIGMSADDWAEAEVIPIWNKSKTAGVLLVQPYEKPYMIGFETGKQTRDSSGRSKAVICDFCYTWRRGGDAGLVTFYSDSHSNNSTSQLCCFDFDCSLHVRTKTNAATMSRAQLREHISPEGRVERLKEHLQKFIDKLSIEPTAT